MKYYIATSIFFDFKEFYRKFQEDLGPRHTFFELAQKLDAKIYQPGSQKANIIHWALSKLIGQPSHWSLASAIVKDIKKEDVIYCTGEDIGTPLAILFKLFRIKAKLAIYFVDPEKLRARYLFKIFNLKSVVRLFAVTDRHKQQSLINRFGINEKNICILPEQTDELFFTPGVGTISKNTFLIACAGMEQRDYLTLSQAISGLDVEVKVCAHSPNLSKKTNFKFPDITPDNMEVRYFEFAELRDLYRSANLVVISLLESPYSAGLTVLMEAMACKKPVIITNNIGLGRELIDKNLVIGVRSCDPDDLKRKIEEVMRDSTLANNCAEKAHEYFLKFHTSKLHIEALTNRLAGLAEEG